MYICIYTHVHIQVHVYVHVDAKSQPQVSFLRYHLPCYCLLVCFRYYLFIAGSSLIRLDCLVNASQGSSCLYPRHRDYKQGLTNLAFYMEVRDQTQVLTLTRQTFYSLSHLLKPIIFLVRDSSHCSCEDGSISLNT